LRQQLREERAVHQRALDRLRRLSGFVPKQQELRISPQPAGDEFVVLSSEGSDGDVE
jgi:hypothetical protein